MHWADAFAKSLSGVQRISTGISPSGPIHVGNMREILTGDMIYKAALRRGLEADFIYLCDDMDPLRKVYPFLSSDYEKYVGKPLYRIPSPDGNGSYSEHFLKPFLETLDTINVKVDVIRTSGLYAQGKFADAIRTVIGKKDIVSGILKKVSGRELEKDWSPYQAICSECGSIAKTKMTGFEDPFVLYRCAICQHEGRADIRRDDGKLPWRLEWPAKWKILNVTVEPFGKDHGAAGGSYDTGKAIAQEIFGKTPPAPLLYEWILLKGKGAMHSSTGNVIPAEEFVRFTPPMVLRFLIAKNNPSRHIELDPALGLLNLVDEFEKYLAAYFGTDSVADPDFRDVVWYSSIGREPYSQEVSFRHLVNLIQIYPGGTKLLNALKKSGYSGNTIDSEMKHLIEVARYWLDTYAPESVKFRLMKEDDPVSLDEAGKSILSAFMARMDAIDWTADSIHNTVHGIIKGLGVDPAVGFSAFYKIFIGRDRGPRLGYFLSNLDRSFAARRIAFSLGMAKHVGK